jgi:Ubiquitin carboxyl-terminal hydrolase
VLYRLAAVVCHYGQHSFGHYVCFRRKPRGEEGGLVASPRLEEPAAPGQGWLRASDDSVREVGIEAVLREGSGVFMLYYERVKSEDSGLPPPLVRSPHGEQRSRDIMVKTTADDVGLGVAVTAEMEKAQGSCLQDAVKCEPVEEEEVVMMPMPVIRARVVRSVSLGRDEPVGGPSANREAEVEGAVVEHSEPSPGPAKPDPEIVLPTLVPLAEVPSSSAIPDSPTVDEHEISHPRTVDLRA